jgi:hypothetical protein
VRVILEKCSEIVERLRLQDGEPTDVLPTGAAAPSGMLRTSASGAPKSMIASPALCPYVAHSAMPAATCSGLPAAICSAAVADER